MKVKILSDSACDLPESIIEEYEIDIMPIVVLHNDNEYFDGQTIKATEVYEGMKEGINYKTAQIPAQMFKEKFTQYAEKNQTVIYIGFSSGLSGTYQTSLLVKEDVKEEYPNLDIHIVDSKAASLGFGMMVLEAAKLAKEGKTPEEILESININKESIHHVFTVDDIEYLYRGGRVSRAQAVIGGILNIKPILIVEDGKLVPIDKSRGKIKALKTMLDIMEKEINKSNISEQLIGISHGDDLDSALKLKDMIEERFGCKDYLINIIGSSIGAHSGPGTLALFFRK